MEVLRYPLLVLRLQEEKYMNMVTTVQHTHGFRVRTIICSIHDYTRCNGSGYVKIV